MEVIENYPLSQLTSFRIGGPARVVYFPETISQLEQLCKKFSGDKFLVLGEGTNVLAPDEGVDFPVVVNRIRGFKIEGERLEALSGEKLDTLVRAAAEAGLSGLEELSGIPGTVGGAVFGNAGAFGRQISDVLEWVEYVKEGEVVREKASSLYFSYRDSTFKRDGGIILKVALKLTPSSRERTMGRREEILRERERKLPSPDTACAGSFFKNILLPDGKKLAAGKLLEEAGMKGKRVGGAQFSTKHANFIVNTGGARARDVLTLAELGKRRVFERFGVKLEEEVIIIDDP